MCARAIARLLVAFVCACVTVTGHHVKMVQEYELSYPLQKEEGEKEDAWALKDDKGVIVLKLRFELK